MADKTRAQLQAEIEKLTTENAELKAKPESKPAEFPVFKNASERGDEFAANFLEVVSKQHLNKRYCYEIQLTPNPPRKINRGGQIVDDKPDVVIRDWTSDTKFATPEEAGSAYAKTLSIKNPHDGFMHDHEAMRLPTGEPYKCIGIYKFENANYVPPEKRSSKATKRTPKPRSSRLVAKS